jgi:hemerythrin-like domain-containing protein
MRIKVLKYILKHESSELQRERKTAMSFTNRICQTLHEEHGATVALMERLEQLLTRYRRTGPPDASDHAVAQLLSALSTGVEAEVERHFAFEENHLFTYLQAAGDQAIGTHLTEEHTIMRPMGVRLAAIARTAAARGFDAAGWEEFRRLGQDLCERMLAHVQKEEMALLPIIEETMDADTEARLYQDYVENQ